MKALLYFGLWLVFTTTNYKKNNTSNDSNLMSKTELGDIIVHLEYGYGLGVQVKYVPYLIFDDGNIYKDFTISPTNFDVQVSKIKNAKAWGTYQIKGKEIIIKWPNKAAEIWKDKTWFKTQSASNGELLNGTYKSISGLSTISMGGTETILSLKNISFLDDKFTYESTGSAVNESTTSYGTHNTSGTYSLDKNVIEFRFNNGTVERKFFFFSSDNKKVFGIGNTYYIQKK